MPEAGRDTPKIVKLKYLAYARTPVDGIPIHTIFVRASDYAALPMDANVRLPNEKSVPYKEMIETLEKNPRNFFLQNSGISIIAETVTPDERKEEVVFKFPPGTGIVNGGHTQLALLNIKNQRDISQAIVKLEVMEHKFTPEQLAVIAASRNTASNVKPYSTAEKKGYFAHIKTQMLEPFEKHIIWYENEEVANNRGMLAVDLIARLNLFNVKKYQSEVYEKPDQPTTSASSKSSVFKTWMDDPSQLFQTYPLVNDIINLEEHILATFHVGAPRGFTTLSVIKKYDPPKYTVFTGRELKWNLPTQFLLPILASFRAVVKYDPAQNKIGWYEKPEIVFDRCKDKVITEVLRTFKSHHNEINRMSKDSNLWRILFDTVSREVDKTKQWGQLRAIPEQASE